MASDFKKEIVMAKKASLKRLLITLTIIAGAVAALVLTGVIANAVCRSRMEEFIDGYGRVEYENQLTPQVDERGNYYFTTDSEFKVLQLTDVHLGGGFFFADGDRKALHAVAAMVEAEKPDLVIVTGDISFAVPWSGTLDNSHAHGYFKRLMENLGVYWTVTFGNHDSEKYNYYDRSAVAEMYLDSSLEYCLFTESPEGVFGESNHIITVKNSLGLIKDAFVMIDSNSYTDKDIFGLGWDYDNVHDDQINWYRENIEYYTAKNLTVYNSLDESLRPAGFNTDAVRSYMFMHIPPEEMRIAYTEAAKGDITDYEKYGIVGEGDLVVYSSAYPDNLFETIVELGSTKGVFFGHDHLNSMRFTYQGVLLAYGCSIDYSAYAGGVGYQRGCATLTVGGEGDAVFTQKNYYSGLYDSLDDGVDMTLPEMYQ